MVGPVDKLSVVLVMVMGVLFLGEKLSARQCLGVAVILAGVLLIAWPSKPAEQTAAKVETTSAPE